MKVLVIANHKGGVGKTTSALNLGPALAQQGMRVLLIDLDPQANLSEGFGLEEPAGRRIEELLLADGVPDLASEAARVGEGLWLVPCSWALGSADAALVERGEGYTHRLSELLEAASASFDVALVDTPPSIGMWSGLALLAADAVLVPVTPAHYDQMGAQKQIAFIEQEIHPHNPKLRVLGVLVTKADPRWRVLRQVRRAAERDGMPMVPGEIPLQIRVAEAVGEGQPTFWLEPDGKIASAYRRTAAYVVDELGLAA